MFEILVTFILNLSAKSLLTYPCLNNTSKRWFSWVIDLVVSSTLGLTRDNSHLNRCTFEMPVKKFNALSSFLILSKSWLSFLFALIYLTVLRSFSCASLVFAELSVSCAFISSKQLVKTFPLVTSWSQSVYLKEIAKM